MAVKRIYSCNFCGRDYTQNRDELLGVHFTGAYQSSTFEYKNTNACENHLCITCIESIKNSVVPDFANPLTA